MQKSQRFTKNEKKCLSVSRRGQQEQWTAGKKTRWQTPLYDHNKVIFSANTGIFKSQKSIIIGINSLFCGLMEFNPS